MKRKRDCKNTYHYHFIVRVKLQIEKELYYRDTITLEIKEKR